MKRSPAVASAPLTPTECQRTRSTAAAAARPPREKNAIHRRRAGPTHSPTSRRANRTEAPVRYRAAVSPASGGRVTTVQVGLNLLSGFQATLKVEC